MNNFINKINLYEFLSIFIPGAAICMEIIFLFLADWQLNELSHYNAEVAHTIIFIVIAYLIGLIHHSFMDIVWDGCNLRNNPKVIYCIKLYGSIVDYLKHHWTSTTQNDKTSNSCFIAKCFRISSHFFRNIFQKKDKDFVQATITQYYSAYYYVITKHNEVICALERQVAFIRNMLLPIFCLFFIADRLVDEQNVMKLRIGILIFIINLLWLAMNRQLKVYKCVFEDNKYFKQL